MTESCPKKTNIAEISPHLICALCGGYLIDATTIVECLHSFCKTCIVRYLESSKYCPICEVLVHKTRPLQNIRLDHTLQDIVYKLVPGLFQSEMRRRREFYKDHPTVRSAKVRQEQQRHRVIYSADEQFSLSLEFCPDGRIRRPSGRKLRRLSSKTEVPERRYLLVPANTTVALLKKFMKLKFALPEKFKVDIFHGKGPLRDHYSMMDVAYIYSWKREGVLQLYYSVYKVPDPVPEITITEVKDEICTEIADDTGQKVDDVGHRADDTRPSILFNKATLLGNHSVDRNIPHDLSPLELIATVANDICIQEGRGLKRKTEDSQLYENDDDNSSTETRQLQKSIERAIDLCSTSNQSSPGCSSGVTSTATVTGTHVLDTRTDSTGTVSLHTPVSSNSSGKTSSNASSLSTNIGNDSCIAKTCVNQKNGDKNIAKEKPKKTDTASQCDPRPKKLKGEAHVQSKSKSPNKIQAQSKERKDTNSTSGSENKTNVRSETKVHEKSAQLKANGVKIIEQNGSAVSDTQSDSRNVKRTEMPRGLQAKAEATTDPKSVPKTINITDKDPITTPKSDNDVTPIPTVTASSSVSQSVLDTSSVSNRTQSTTVKISSIPPSTKSSCTSKTSSLPSKMQNSQNKVPISSATTKINSKVSAQSPSKVSATLLKSSPAQTKIIESVRSVTQINGHSSPSEMSKQQSKASNIVKVHQNENKDF